MVLTPPPMLAYFVKNYFMKQLTLFFAAVLVLGHTAFGQNNNKPSVTLKEVMTLKIDREGGANGANIAWHPKEKKYYAAMAGNESFPMEVFDAKGKMLSDNSLETFFDVRGLWYNSAAKALQMNGYDNAGWAEYKLNNKGIPISALKLSISVTQPDAQCVGAFDDKTGSLYYYDYATTTVQKYNIKTGDKGDAVELHLGAKTSKDIKEGDETTKDLYNQNAIIFTGIPHAEIGLLNVDAHSIDLYNMATGFLTKSLKLPENAPAENSLNFSFCNGIYWTFDKKDRVWHGYK